MSYITFFIFGIIIGLILYQVLFPNTSNNKGSIKTSGMKIGANKLTPTNYATKDDLDKIRKEMEDWKNSLMEERNADTSVTNSNMAVNTDYDPHAVEQEFYNQEN